MVCAVLAIGAALLRRDRECAADGHFAFDSGSRLWRNGFKPKEHLKPSEQSPATTAAPSRLNPSAPNRP